MESSAANIAAAPAPAPNKSSCARPTALHRSRPHRPPATAAAVAGGLCGLLLCNAVGLAQLDLLGAGAGAAAMFAALDSMGAPEKEKVEAK